MLFRPRKSPLFGTPWLFKVISWGKMSPLGLNVEITWFSLPFSSSKQDNSLPLMKCICHLSSLINRALHIITVTPKAKNKRSKKNRGFIPSKTQASSTSSSPLKERKLNTQAAYRTVIKPISTEPYLLLAKFQKLSNHQHHPWPFNRLFYPNPVQQIHSLPQYHRLLKTLATSTATFCYKVRHRLSFVQHRPLQPRLFVWTLRIWISSQPILPPSTQPILPPSTSSSVLKLQPILLHQRKD